MTFNEAAWCAEVAAYPGGKITYDLSLKGLTTLLSTPDDYWSSLISRLHQFLENETLSFECKWYIEDMQRLRDEYKRDGKMKCLDERARDLLKIYFKWFYGMVGRMNKEGAFPPPPYGDGPPVFASNVPSRVISGIGSSSSSRIDLTMSSSAGSYPPAYATNDPLKIESGASTSSSGKSYPPAYTTNARSKMMSGVGSGSSSRASTISSSSSRPGSNMPAKTELNRAFGDSTRTMIPAMVTDEELDEMEAEIKMKKKEGLKFYQSNEERVE